MSGLRWDRLDLEAGTEWWLMDGDRLLWIWSPVGRRLWESYTPEMQPDGTRCRATLVAP